MARCGVTSAVESIYIYVCVCVCSRSSHEDSSPFAGHDPPFELTGLELDGKEGFMALTEGPVFLGWFRHCKAHDIHQEVLSPSPLDLPSSLRLTVWWVGAGVGIVVVPGDQPGRAGI